MSNPLPSGLLISCALGFGTGAAFADTDAPSSPLTFSVTYRADLVGVSEGAGSRSRFLDNLDMVADLDLGRAVHWSGAKARLHLLNNSGGAPNDIANTLQGVDNIEVERQRAKLYQAWIEQGFAGDRASLRLGLYDLNSEFYVTEAASLFMAPAFGIGSELASTGPNGPSIFPSTALAARLDWRASDTVTLRGAVLNARAGVLGDPGSVNIDFADGALVVAEAVYADAADIAFGVWRYSERQDDLRDLDMGGTPQQRLAQGAYVSAQKELLHQANGRRATGFVRIGVSDGDTTPYAGGWQSGIDVARVIRGRPESRMSLGMYQGVLSSKFRANERDAARDPDRAETSFEITYSDRLLPHLSVQPDLQFFPNPGADSGRDATWAGAVRLTVDL